MEIIIQKFEFDENKQMKQSNVGEIIQWQAYEGVVRVVPESSDDDLKMLEALTMNKHRLPQFPRLLGNFLPNLTVLSLNRCGLKKIERKDLMGLKNLKQLMLAGNKITELPGDLFKGTPKLEAASFYGNRITIIGVTLFNPLKNLCYFNLKMNYYINMCFKVHGNGVILEHLETYIKDFCQPDSYSKRQGVLETMTIPAEDALMHWNMNEIFCISNFCLKKTNKSGLSSNKLKI